MIDLSMRQVPEAGYQIVYLSPIGETWNLATRDHGLQQDQRVLLLKGGLAGGVGAPNFSTADSVTQMRQLEQGWKLPPISGKLTVRVSDEPHKLAFTLRRWLRSWSAFEDGALKIIARDGGSASIPVRLTEVPEIPGDPAGQRFMEVTIGWQSMQGHWDGPTLEYSGRQQIAPAGDLPPSCRIRWQQATTVTFPSRLVTNFPQVDSPRLCHLDRGLSGMVTDLDGVVDSATWSQFRGSLVGTTMRPYTKHEWNIGAGASLLVTPRYLSPWR